MEGFYFKNFISFYNLFDIWRISYLLQTFCRLLVIVQLIIIIIINSNKSMTNTIEFDGMIESMYTHYYAASKNIKILKQIAMREMINTSTAWTNSKSMLLYKQIFKERDKTAWGQRALE